MIENPSQTLARSYLATTWPQALSPDAARPVAEDQSLAATSQTPARAAQTSPSQTFSPVMLAPALATLGSEPVPGGDAGTSARQGGDADTAADQGRSRYAAASRSGTPAAAARLDVRV